MKHSGNNILIEFLGLFKYDAIFVLIFNVSSLHRDLHVSHISGTMMCYGQTGAGKTFTMCGATENYQHRGMIPRAISQLFKEIEERPEFAITCR